MKNNTKPILKRQQYLRGSANFKPISVGNTNQNPLLTIKITKLQPLSIKHHKPNLETLTNNTKKPPTNRHTHKPHTHKLTIPKPQCTR